MQPSNTQSCARRTCRSQLWGGHALSHEHCGHWPPCHLCCDHALAWLLPPAWLSMLAHAAEAAWLWPATCSGEALKKPAAHSPPSATQQKLSWLQGLAKTLRLSSMHTHELTWSICKPCYSSAKTWVGPACNHEHHVQNNALAGHASLESPYCMQPFEASHTLSHAAAPIKKCKKLSRDASIIHFAHRLSSCFICWKTAFQKMR